VDFNAAGTSVIKLSVGQMIGTAKVVFHDVLSRATWCAASRAARTSRTTEPATEYGVKVLVDSYSQRYLKGANIDYIESLMGSGFKINNPNVTKSCSCGHSFNTD